VFSLNRDSCGRWCVLLSSPLFFLFFPLLSREATPRHSFLPFFFCCTIESKRRPPLFLMRRSSAEGRSCIASFFFPLFFFFFFLHARTPALALSLKRRSITASFPSSFLDSLRCPSQVVAEVKGPSGLLALPFLFLRGRERLPLTHGIGPDGGSRFFPLSQGAVNDRRAADLDGPALSPLSPSQAEQGPGGEAPSFFPQKRQLNTFPLPLSRVGGAIQRELAVLSCFSPFSLSRFKGR